MNRFADFYAQGKLLLSGEYLVLAGAQALAIPLKVGQSMQVRPLDNNRLIWEARCPQGLWFSATFQLPSLALLSATNNPLAMRLEKILREAFLAANRTADKGVYVLTQMDFNPEFGFGSSATLISLLSQWLEFNAFDLHHSLFGGSGYDIACATADSPIFYSWINHEPQVIPVHFYPEFYDRLYFVYLGKKQQSSREVAQFTKQKNYNLNDIHLMSQFTKEICQSVDLDAFEKVLEAHEMLMSRILSRPAIKEISFADYSGAVKSLGAWGGDFVLVTSRKAQVDFRDEMKKRGFDVVYSFEQLVKH